jgi:hypothetical protein
MESSNRLPILAAEISAAHDAAIKAAESAVGHAIQAGQKLIEAKSLLGHGQWLPWLHQIGIEPRSAQRYMRLAKVPNASSVTHLGIAAALDAIAIHHAPKEPESEPPWRRPLEDGEIEFPLADVTFRPELYPRSSVPQDIVERYVSLLPYLPAIEINQRQEIIDGYLRYLAHKQASTFDTIRCIVTDVGDDLEHLKLAVKRNATHGIQLPLQDELEFAIEEWRRRMLVSPASGSRSDGSGDGA